MNLTCATNPAACLASGAWGALWDAAAHWVANSVAWFGSQLGHVLTSTGRPELMLTASHAESSRLSSVVPLIAVLAIVASVITSVRQADPGGLVRALGAGLLIMAASLSLARPLGALVVSVADQLSRVAGTSASTDVTRWTQAAALLPPTTPSFALLALAGAETIGAAALWCELLVRDTVLTYLLVLAPFIGAAAPWPPARRWMLRLVETFVGLALAKVFVVIALALGAQEIASSSVVVILSGAVTLGFAALTPFFFLRLVPLLEGSALHATEGVRRRVSASVLGAGARVAGAAFSGGAAAVAPQRADEYGLGQWSGGEREFAFPAEGESGPSPVGRPRPATGHTVFGRDEYGPVVHWHADD